MALPYAAYPRVSRVGDRGDRLLSPELQLDRIRAHARAHGLPIEELPPELDESGGKVERPILEQAIRGIEEGRYAGIIVAQLDRLSRMDIADAYKTIQRIEKAGGRVISVAENFDESTPEGELSRTMMLALSRMQLKRYSNQFAAAKRSAVERGIWPVHKAPYGYLVKARKHGGDGKLYPDPEKAPKVRRAFEKRAAGHTWGSIGDDLGLAATTVAKIVRNRVYLGEIKLEVLGETIRNPAAHEPLVTRDLWEAAQLNHPRPSRNNSSVPALLAGLVRCAGCQGTMTINTFTKGGRGYRCMAARRADGRCQAPAIIGQKRIDQYVEDAVLAHLQGIRYDAAKLNRTLEEAQAELDAAEAELAAYQEITAVTAIGAEHFAAGMRARVERVETARERLGRARAAAGPAPDPGQLLELWDDLDVEERRHVLRSSLGVVWVRKGRGNVADRVRIIAAGYEPPGLSRPGRYAPIQPLDWIDGDLPGEIRPTGTQYVP